MSRAGEDAANKAAEPFSTYAEAHEALREFEAHAFALVRHHADIADTNERGALGQCAREAARALNYLADTYDLLGRPWWRAVAPLDNEHADGDDEHANSPCGADSPPQSSSSDSSSS